MSSRHHYSPKLKPHNMHLYSHDQESKKKNKALSELNQVENNLIGHIYLT
ncbi:hypothetical protein HanPSC8_Chr08g0322141 [Helianthus annuus]|nr:hypothetical protein HanPSC8_Chr08g0322141 [Helianthus annuus]